MIKKQLTVLIVTSAAILLPILIGIILWNQLPEQLPVHWNAAGEVDGYSGKAFAVFGLPFILLGAHLIVVFGTLSDPKKQNHSGKLLHVIFWFIPVLSILLMAVTYCTALGKSVRVEVILPIFIGILFMIVGNYMPKCRQNYTIGIKIPWTLSSEENWNRTHRMAGRLWVIGGFAVVLGGFFGALWIVLAAALTVGFVPVIYSYVLYRKGI